MDNGADNYRRFLQGDDEGLTELIRKYKDGLMLYVNQYVQNIHLAEELMEETFVRLATKRPRFSGKSSFKTWLFAIGRHVAVDELRKRKNLPSVSAKEVPLLLQDEADLERDYLRDEEKIQLHRALKAIHGDYGRVLYLLYFEGFTLPQAAAILKKSYKQTENLSYRAKRALKAQLEKEGFVYENL